MENPAFTAELDVSKGSSYGRFIAGVRDQLVLHAGATRHLELVLLPHQHEDPRKAPWFGVTLRRRSGDSVLLRLRADNLYLRRRSGDSVLLRLRADNLYLCGYRRPDGRWWEFRGGSLIAGATPLSFPESYGDMANAANVALEKLTLGMEELEAAAGQLATAEGNAGSEQYIAKSLMVISVMVCEAIRFRSVGGALGHIACNAAARRTTLPAHMVAQVKKWSSLSENWLGAVLYGQPFLPYIEAGGIQQYNCNIPLHLLAPTKIDCQDNTMMALGVALNRQRNLEDEYQAEMDEHWRAVRARARKLDRTRPSASGI